jgi:hypothetical protein
MATYQAPGIEEPIGLEVGGHPRLVGVELDFSQIAAYPLRATDNFSSQCAGAAVYSYSSAGSQGAGQRHDSARWRNFFEQGVDSPWTLPHDCHVRTEHFRCLLDSAGLLVVG